jgi:Sec-independent protein translocase protein TatA
MRTIGIGQIIVLICVTFLLFGDTTNVKEKLHSFMKKLNDHFYR